MKPIPKHIILIPGCILIIFLGYLIFQNFNLSQSGLKEKSISPVDTDIGTSRNTSPSIITQSGNRTNTPWGDNPFQTGTTSTGEVKKTENETLKPKSTKLEFQKPDTTWKSRTLSGVTYVFGEGNPKEVALSESEMKGCSYQEGGDYCTDSGAGYVDPILEKLVYDLLASPDWVPLLQHCEKDFRIVDSFLQRDDPNSPIIYNTLVHLGQYISMEEMFAINPQTGRKNITKEGYNKLIRIYEYLRSATSDYGGNPYPGISKCVETYGNNIASKLINIRWLPWRGSRDIPESQ